MTPPLAHILPRLPIEIFSEIVRLAPTSSFRALCLVNHYFYGLAARELYEDVVLLCTTPEGIDTIELICRAQQWCHTVTENPRTTILVKSVTFELPKFVDHLLLPYARSWSLRDVNFCHIFPMYSVYDSRTSLKHVPSMCS